MGAGIDRMDGVRCRLSLIVLQQSPLADEIEAGVKLLPTNWHILADDSNCRRVSTRFQTA